MPRTTTSRHPRDGSLEGFCIKKIQGVESAIFNRDSIDGEEIVYGIDKLPTAARQFRQGGRRNDAATMLKAYRAATRRTPALV